MKLLFPSLLLLSTLAGCSNDEPTPAPALTGGTWTFQSERVVATPKNGSAATTTDVPPTTGPVTLTYTDATHFKLDVRDRNPASGYRVESTYAYTGQDLAYAVFRNWNTERNVPKTVQVKELSAHKLVTAEKWEGADSWYVTTLTYTR